MFDKWLMRVLAAPFALLYGIGVGIKTLLYRIGLLSGVKFSIPVINVGNLTVGGTGKTPHVEYLIRLLSPYVNVATMSRGYKRKTRGFLIIRPGYTSDQAGDEPLLYARKYRNIVVTVSESRALGIPKLIQAAPGVQAILMDDAFQHRGVEPHLNILLTEYDHPFYRDWLLPAGRLREWRSGYRRADMIIVTKCPDVIPDGKRYEIISSINPLPHQNIFFTRYRYGIPYQMWAPQNRQTITEEHRVLLVCGIARTDYLLSHLNAKAGAVNMLEFEDHHDYSRYDLEKIKKYYDHLGDDGHKMILTTEKDAMRLERFKDTIFRWQLPVFILPVEVAFLYDGEEFNETIKKFLLEFKV